MSRERLFMKINIEHIAFALALSLNATISSAELGININPDDYVKNGNFYYLTGDCDRAITEYEKESAQGSANASNALGSSVYLPISGAQACLRPNFSLAMEYLELATKQGSPSAPHTIGQVFSGTANLIGADVAINFELANKYYSLAASRGNLEAMITLGNNYLLGKNGVSKSPKVAYKYFLEAAMSDDRVGKEMVGISHLEGVGVPKNHKIARQYFLDAKTEGSFYHLGRMYQEGLGVKINKPLSYVLYSLAESYALYSAEMSARVGKKKDDLEKTLAKNDIDAAQSLYQQLFTTSVIKVAEYIRTFD